MSAAPPDEPTTLMDEFPIDTRPLRDEREIAARDAAWLEKVYDPRVPQFTLRAAATGAIFGAVLSISDLYIGLKVGWIFGMSITSSVLTFAVFSGLGRVFPGMRALSPLETNTSQTVASAAAYMSSAGLVSSIPALTMLTRDGTITLPPLTSPMLMTWLFFISCLGVVIAIPVKRSMINAEQLRFPTGLVCAETIRTMHSSGKEALHKARALVFGGLFAATLKFVVDSKLGFLRRIPEHLALPGSLYGRPVAFWSFRLNTSLLLYAAGVIVGIKVASSLLLGAIFNYAVVGPWLLHHDVLRLASPEVAADPAAWKAFQHAAEAAHVLPVRSADVLYRELRAKWSVWPGTSLMVAASVVAFAFRFRTIGRALRSLSGLVTMFRKDKRAADVDPLASVEVSPRWFAIGVVVTAIACIVMQRAWFDVPIFEGIVSIVLAFVLSVVAARATGETNITPISAMGKITQLTFGVLMPGNATANLMTATVTAGAAAHSADLLTEVKTGYLLGAAPRKQFFAQLVGVAVGALACVPIYLVLARPERLGVDLAAPAAVAWASVAKLLKDGPSNLPLMALDGIIVGGVVGALLAVLDEFAPARLRPFVPSAIGLGIALVIDANDSLAMFLGAFGAWIAARAFPVWSRRTSFSAASGIVAGEGLMGVVVIVLRDVFHLLPT
jgi:OPT family oligopeptide transporter